MLVSVINNQPKRFWGQFCIVDDLKTYSSGGISDPKCTFGVSN